MVAHQRQVGISDIVAAKGEVVFTCFGLGSCIGFVAADPGASVAGMVHLMLPKAFPGKAVDKPGKFADTGIPRLFQALTDLGADPDRLIVAYAGGAQILQIEDAVRSRLDIGARNAAAVAETLESLGITVAGIDVGGTSARTVAYCSQTGEFKVRTVSGCETVLCNLLQCWQGNDGA